MEKYNTYHAGSYNREPEDIVGGYIFYIATSISDIDTYYKQQMQTLGWNITNEGGIPNVVSNGCIPGTKELVFDNGNMKVTIDILQFSGSGTNYVSIVTNSSTRVPPISTPTLLETPTIISIWKGVIPIMPGATNGHELEPFFFPGVTMIERSYQFTTAASE